MSEWTGRAEGDSLVPKVASCAAPVLDRGSIRKALARADGSTVFTLELASKFTRLNKRKVKLHKHP
ncbi:MAG: hypothetical protein Q7N50_13495 [Armatimonadota bacterium]|nr:hypothetical protein [Armatimonadota bacterium]